VNGPDDVYVERKGLLAKVRGRPMFSWSPIRPTTIGRWTKARGRLVASPGNCACRIYGLGCLYFASLVARGLLIMWTFKQARPYAVVFAIFAPLAIAFYPIWLLLAWRPSRVRAWLDSQPDMAKKYDDGVDQLYGELGHPRTLRQKAVLGEALEALEGHSLLASIVLKGCLEVNLPSRSTI
jgi:hypothetical protein